MKYQLIKDINPQYSTVEQILTNRGMKREDIPKYLNASQEDINSPLLFGEQKMEQAFEYIRAAAESRQQATIIVDSDADGFTSAALFLNYFYDLYPDWITSNVSYILHSGKQHGLSDCIIELSRRPNSLIIIPDAGTNDTKQCLQLSNLNCKIVILDHHIQDINNPYAVIINNQTSDYPNKDLSGVGVVWQFCKYYDSRIGVNEANKYIDLVAVGDQGDMMDLRSVETAFLVKEGLKDQNIKNPFIYSLIQKNRFSIGNEITPIGISFYVVPFINAMVRSGTMEQKEILFASMLKWRAFEKVPSTKRGHKIGDTESICEQAVRIVNNVKARQTKVQQTAVEVMKKKIEEENLLNHKVLLFLLKPGQIDKNVAGLIANKIMAKYQRPVCILTKVIKAGQKISYQGSARGCSKVGINDFKGVCAATGECMYEAGHQNAFGLGIYEQNIQAFLEKTDAALKDASNEAIYYVDYIWDKTTIDENKVLDIANLSHLWGQGLDESEIAIENLKISEDMVSVYEKRGITIKISLDNGVSLLLFNAKEEDKQKLKINNSGYVQLNIVGKCNKNEWMGRITPQIFITDYQITDSNEYFF